MMITQIPRFPDTDTEFVVRISHVGQEYVYTQTYPVPRLEDGSVDKAAVDQLGWQTYAQAHENRNTIWPERTPDPYEREIADSAVELPPEPARPTANNESPTATDPEPGVSPTAPPTEPISPYGPGEMFGPAAD